MATKLRAGFLFNDEFILGWKGTVTAGAVSPTWGLCSRLSFATKHLCGPAQFSAAMIVPSMRRYLYPEIDMCPPLGSQFHRAV